MLPPPSLSLELRQAADNKIWARLRITNLAAQPYPLLRWLLFPDGVVDADRFDITLAGRTIAYTGPAIRRPLPTDTDFLALPPGQTSASAFTLGDVYRINTPGDLLVRYLGFNPLPGDAGLHRLQSNQAKLVLAAS